MKHYFELYDDNWWLERCQEMADDYVIGWDNKHVYVKSQRLNKIVHYFRDDLRLFCIGLLTKLGIEAE